MPKNDPYHDVRPVHMAKMISEHGSVSPACATEYPRALDLKRDKWTTDKAAVTCKACLKLIKP